jgi:hypothetical protein
MCHKTPRWYACAACHQAVLICPQCDRGNIYCAGGCARQRRQASQRRASARYQQTPQGKHRHAARQAAWRGRKKKVTHQGSDPPPETAIVQAHAPVLTVESSDVQAMVVQSLAATMPAQLTSVICSFCSFCRQAVSRFFRTDRLRR